VPQGRTLEEMRGERIRVRSVSDGYLTAMGVPLLDGRELERGDNANAPPVIVVNRSAAGRYFGTTSPVGQMVDWHVGKGHARVRVVGVVEDLRQRSPSEAVFPEIFVDYRQFLNLQATWGESPQRQNEGAIGFLSFALRTSGDPARTVPVVREVLNAVDPNIGIDAILPMTHLEASSFSRERFYAVMLGVFASVAGLLAAIGIYGVIAYAVIQRTQEIGIRMALGAQGGNVVSMVVRQAMLLAGGGLALGLIAALALSRTMTTLLFNLSPTDPVTFASVAGVLAFVAFLASYLPARRAASVDPMEALRSE
jgi:putative ABC transport system permease protein